MAGHAECVKLLIPVSNPQDDCSSALQWAARNGHVTCVELLIPVSDPKAKNSLALYWAVISGNLECVNLLIPVSDCKIDDSIPLMCAAVQKNVECMELLFAHSDPHQALKAMKKKHPDDKDLHHFFDNFIAAKEQQLVLQCAVGANSKKTSARKM